MPENKKFQDRIRILDECFANGAGSFTIEKLILTVEEKLKISISRSSIEKDIRYIRQTIENNFCNEFDFDEQPVFIKNLYDSINVKQNIFKYSNKKFALGNQLLSKSNKDQLEETLAILSRYKNREDFFWLNELFPRIESAFNLVHDDYKGLISYQTNRDYSGEPWVGKLYNQLIKRKVLIIKYKGYNDIQSYQRTIHPYHLKQYNNRWFLFGWQVGENFTGITNVALDRIIDFTETIENIKPDPIKDWGDYFDEFIGVSKPLNEEVVSIKLRFTKNRIKYVTTKPIHDATQRLDTSDLEKRTIIIDIIPNRELYQTLLSFGSDVKVLEPKKIVDNMNERINEMKKIYK